MTTHSPARWILTIVGLLTSLPVGAAEPSFVLRTLNAEATYNACAVFDVNGNGRLDIVSGGFWYEAPTWKRHFLRDVQMIGGRYDDYSNLPLDVNGNGWPDLVSVNYRSKSLYWVEHPGPSLGPWKTHVIDTPGAMETGRLVDIDGDGRLDLLPNGVQFAAWYELIPPSPSGKEAQPVWVRHDLPKEIAGHGIGFGDINGNGRGDLVGPRGWLEAPEDRRAGRWRFHPEFELDRDASIPILVFDVDGDGDNDIVWGRGHNIGLYWLEQTRDEQGDRRWIRHAIDTSWSQPHSLLLADVDNDGRKELIAGKRYMGHDGRDPGEYDPLVAYWYKFDPQRRTWKRHVISGGGPAGFGLDPKAIDVDGDGDLDIVVADRSGLYWFENQLIGGDAAAATTEPVDPQYDDHASLLVYRGPRGELHDVDSRATWAIRRSHILLGMQQAMGTLPDSHLRVPLELEIIGEVDAGKYVRRQVTFAAEPDDRVPAYLLVPKGIQSPRPAMLCLHQTTNIGKGEPAGLGGRPTLHYAHELAERGYVCIVPDYPSFGDYAYDFHLVRDQETLAQPDFRSASHYVSGSMKAIWNNLRAVDLLETLPEVDRDRIGVIGHSLGGHNALFTAAFDQRLKAVATSCGFTPFHHYYGGKLAGWTSDRYMPRIRDRYGNDPDRVPFDFYEVVAAIAPRGLFINAPLGDSNFDVEGVRKVVQRAGAVYKLTEAAGRLVVDYPDSAHDFPDDIRRRCYAWLDEQLK